ncbi:MAG: hypothetical protein IPL49_04520 [Saprospirales bacterium]|nr:hypothetical protein [Saprospirales bacterium]
MNPHTLLFSLHSALTIFSACTPSSPPTAPITGQLRSNEALFEMTYHDTYRLEPDSFCT